MPLIAVALVEYLPVLLGAVLDVAVAVPVEEVLVSPDQERPGAARGVHYLQPARPAARTGLLTLQELPDGVLDDVVNDVGRGVVDASRLANLRLLLDLGPVAAGGKTDHLPEELLVDLPQHINREHAELVGTLRVVQATDYPLEYPVVYVQRERQGVGLFLAVALAPEVEQARVVAVVGLPEQLAQTPVDVVAVQERHQASVVLDAPVLGHAEEDDAVYRHLDGEVELAHVQVVSQGQVPGQEVAPALDLMQECRVHRLRAPSAPGLSRVPV